jgi:hypothetical protein
LVNKLRKMHREAQKKIRELESKQAVVPAEKPVTLGAKPTLEGSDYDADKFEAVANKAWNLLTDWSVDDMVALMARKQHDYGHENVEKFGAAGVKVRLCDKIARYTPDPAPLFK